MTSISSRMSARAVLGGSRAGVRLLLRDAQVDSPILLAPFRRGVVRDRMPSAVPLCFESGSIDAEIYELIHRVDRSILRKSQVVRGVADVVGVSGNLDVHARI